MPILIKLIQAILLGLVMVFALMLLITVTFAFLGFFFEMIGLRPVSEKFHGAQKIVWNRTKVWFFRYKNINEGEN